jgi:glucosamine--fructose-6-phosphate aminotransferase (isomerizing)
VGYGDGETYLGSDAIALAPFAQGISYLEDGDWVVLSRQRGVIRDANDSVVTREVLERR